MTKPLARVLVVEDHPDIGDMMRLALGRSLLDATVCLTGEEALARLTRETYDLILLDIALPGISGLEVCRRLKADVQLAPIPVIFVSCMVSKENKAEAERLGAVDFIEKPFGMFQLLSRVMGHLSLLMNGEHVMRSLRPVPVHSR